MFTRPQSESKLYQAIRECSVGEFREYRDDSGHLSITWTLEGKNYHFNSRREFLAFYRAIELLFTRLHDPLEEFRVS